MKTLFAYILVISISLPTNISLAEGSGNLHEGLFIIDNEHSSVSFTGIQEQREFQGSFSQFYATVNLTPSEKKISATVKTGSVNSNNEDRDKLLLGEDWLSIDIWPEASFTSMSVEITEEGNYIANGQLTIRDVTQAVELHFSLPSSANSPYPRLIGDMHIRRLDFDLGSGEWIDLRWVDNPVKIHVDLQLVPAPPMAKVPE